MPSPGPRQQDSNEKGKFAKKESTDKDHIKAAHQVAEDVLDASNEMLDEE